MPRSGRTLTRSTRRSSTTSTGRGSPGGGAPRQGIVSARDVARSGPACARPGSASVSPVFYLHSHGWVSGVSDVGAHAPRAVSTFIDVALSSGIALSIWARSSHACHQGASCAPLMELRQGLRCAAQPPAEHGEGDAHMYRRAYAVHSCMTAVCACVLGRRPSALAESKYAVGVPLVTWLYIVHVRQGVPSAAFHSGQVRHQAHDETRAIRAETDATPCWSCICASKAFTPHAHGSHLVRS
jgi:hypothetical protein